MRWRVFYDDCLNVLRTLPDDSVDSIVTDPPAGIEFMGGVRIYQSSVNPYLSGCHPSGAGK